MTQPGKYPNPQLLHPLVFLLHSTNVGPDFTTFISAGGVLLVLATTQTVLPASQTCTAPLGLLQAVLGPSRLAGCTCGSVSNGNSAVGKYNLTAGIAVLGQQGGAAVAAVNVSESPSECV